MRDGAKLPPSCPQEKQHFYPGQEIGRSAVNWQVNTPTSEDCLYLNLWVPERVLASRRESVIKIEKKI